MTNKSKSPAGDQSDRTMTFNGMTNAPEVSKPNYNTNHWSGHLNDGRDVNFGRGPTRGNASSSPIRTNAGGNPTRDPQRMTVAEVAGVPATRAYPKNSDSINYGSQQRGAGGTAVRKPSNPDMINPEKNPTNPVGASWGDKKPAKKPVDPDSINLGPSRQYAKDQY